jgi:hypothetical protein
MYVMLLCVQVTDFCTAYPTFTEKQSTADVATEEEEEDPASSYVLLVSGLEFGSTLVASSPEGTGEGEGGGVDDVMSLELSTQMLADFVSGRLGGEEQMHLASRIGR